MFGLEITSTPARVEAAVVHTHHAEYLPQVEQIMAATMRSLILVVQEREAMPIAAGMAEATALMLAVAIPMLQDKILQSCLTYPVRLRPQASLSFVQML